MTGTFCTNCQTSFSASLAELELRARLAPMINGEAVPIPAPRLCPDCRMQRRLIWRNELNLFRGTDCLTGQSLITFIPPSANAKVTTVENWHSDRWDELQRGREYDFSRPFFPQFAELVRDVPLIALANIRCQNSPYANCAAECKNCHLIGGANNDEDCLYGNYVNRSKNCVENNFIDGCELCYECIDCVNCYNTRFSQNCQSSSDSWFLYGCRNSSHCFGCVNLANATHCFYNQQLSPDDYQQRLSEIKLSSRRELETIANEFSAFRLRFPHRAYQGDRLENVIGSSINNSRNCENCFDATDLENCYNAAWLHSAHDCIDIFSWGLKAELCYECLEVGDNSYHALFSATTWSSTNILYCYLTKSSRSCFGSVGLRNREHCILNRQYSKSEYDALLARIVAQMQQTGEWGEFFPMSCSPHAYNTSACIDYFPLLKTEAAALGAAWYEPEASTTCTTFPSVPDNIEHVADSVLTQTFCCAQSQKPFKFIAPELAFYRRQQLPLPDRCFPERHRARLARRAPRKIWPRSCEKCGRPTPSVFAPTRAEIVYCVECYRHEVA